ncbi:MAG: ATP-binding protein, partial [Microbacterium sp.]
MDATPFAIATRLLLIGVVAVCVIALVWAAFDRRRARRARVPILGLAFLVALSVLPTFWSDLPLVMAMAQASFPIFVVLFATYPDGRIVPRWTIALIVAWIPLTVWIVASGGTLTSESWWWTVPTATGIALIAAQFHRYLRRSTQAEREATRWAILGLGSSMLLFLVLGLIGEIGTLGTDAEAWANLAGIPFLVGPTIGLVRPRLWNVDAAFRAVLTIAGAALPLAVVYAGVSVVASSLGAPTSAAGWWGAAAVAAAAYPVIRLSTWLATLVVYRGRGDADSAAARLAERLDDLPDPLAVSETVALAVAEAVRTDAVELRGDVFSARVGVAPAVGGASEEFPLALHGEILATLVVWPRPGEEALTVYDRALVERLALHSAPALHGARALAELTATHARLLLAREEERRRLRRDLHDDLSPTLSGLRLSAAALARRAQAVDPDLAETATELAHDIQDAVEQTREIAYGLRPPVLDDRGLVAAIRDRIHGQSAGERVRIEVLAPDGPLDVPAAVDLAALRIVQEAVANVRRHSGAAHCTVAIECDPGELRVRVDDDGRGIPDRVRPGLGLASIRERAAELGGSAIIGRSDRGGASVVVRLPFEVPVPVNAPADAE